MGVWQVTNETQPHVGQWDAKADKFWDGLGWVDYYPYVPRNPTEFGIGTGMVITQTAPAHFKASPAIEQIKRQMEEAQKAYQNWQAAIQALPPAQPKQETQPQAQDPWEALKSMF